MKAPQYVVIVGILATCLLGSGCVTGSGRAAPPVVKLKVPVGSEWSDLASQARLFCKNNYSNVCALLFDDTESPPAHFTLHFVANGPVEGAWSYPIVKRIYINTDYPRLPGGNQLEAALLHEMAHIAMRGGQRSARHWLESVADYCILKLGPNDGSFCLACTAASPHYKSGYRCGATFLSFVESNYAPNIVRQLTRQLCRRTYTDRFFQETTGRTLDALWAEFTKTSAFTPGAAKALEVQAALGFTNGKPPRDVISRFREFASQQTGRSLKDISYANFRPGEYPCIDTLIEFYLCDTLPGNTPEISWLVKQNNYKLPGLKSRRDKFVVSKLNYDELAAQAFPKMKTLSIMQQHDQSVYHYKFRLRSAGEKWEVIQAWRTTATGQLLENYEMP